MALPLKQELEDLKDDLLLMASKASASVAKAVEAIDKRDDQLALEVESDDTEIDRMEIEIDKKSINLLAKAPLARDLRLIIIALKICTDLERIGDEATTIARRAQALNDFPASDHVEEIREMATTALEMIDAAIKSFAHEMPEEAKEVIPRDKVVDRFNKAMRVTLTEEMQRDSTHIPRSLDLMVVSKSIERIADHAKNIAEEVVYLFQAVDIRHRNLTDS